MQKIWRLLTELRPNLLWDGIKELIRLAVHPLTVPTLFWGLTFHHLAQAALVVGLLLLIRIFAKEIRLSSTITEAVPRSRLAIEWACSTLSCGDQEILILLLRNCEHRIETTLYDVRVWLTLTYATGEYAVMRAPLLESGTLGQPNPTVSLRMLETIGVGILVRHNRGFYKAAPWPFDPQRADRLRCGEWLVEVHALCDSPEDWEEVALVMQLNPDGTFHWDPATSQQIAWARSLRLALRAALNLKADKD